MLGRWGCGHVAVCLWICVGFATFVKERGIQNRLKTKKGRTRLHRFGLRGSCHEPVDQGQPPNVCTSTSAIEGKASNKMMRSRSDSRKGITPLKVSVNGTSLARRLMM